MHKLLRWGRIAIVLPAFRWLTTWDANAESVGEAGAR